MLESTQKLGIGMHDITDDVRGRHSAGSHSGSCEETGDRNEVPMNESLSSDGQSQSSGGSHDRINSKATSTTADADGVRQGLKFDGEASEMTHDPKRCKESVRKGEVCESTAPPGVA